MSVVSRHVRIEATAELFMRETRKRTMTPGLVYTPVSLPVAVIVLSNKLVFLDRKETMDYPTNSVSSSMCHLLL